MLFSPQGKLGHCVRFVSPDDHECGSRISAGAWSPWKPPKIAFKFHQGKAVHEFTFRVGFKPPQYTFLPRSIVPTTF